ncbi:hypothetical protein FRC00_013757 [Tulasnella sp. 408]|nr:hypothetical protein FRC00_013757 [Tulasnella sp. 408]
MVYTAEHTDSGSLDLEVRAIVPKSPGSRPTTNLLQKSWRQRLKTFRIDPSQLSYANKGKVVASGGYGSVRRAILLPQISKTDGNPDAQAGQTITLETAVAVKSLQAHGDIDLERFEKVRGGQVHVTEEAYIWSQLKHTNILEFLGFHFLHSEGEVEALLVCPWFDNGQSIGYIKRNRLSPMQRLRLSNLLIKDNGRAALCDFGSAHELDEMFQDIASKTTQRCTVRWASPERLDSNDPPTPSSDVWSWGWLTWEIMTEKVPFPLLTNVSAVIFHIITAKVPSCEKETGFTGLPHLSQFIQRCWQSTPDSRPSILDAISKLRHILEPNQSGGDFIQTGGAPYVEASLSDPTQRQPQSLLGPNNKTTPERAVSRSRHSTSVSDEGLRQSAQSQTSIEVSNMSNPAVWTPEVDRKLPGYLPHPLYGDYFPPLLHLDTSPLLSTGHLLETPSYTADPEAPRPVIVDQQGKARVSSPEPVRGGTNGEPSATPDRSGHGGPGPSRLVMSKSPEILAEITSSDSPASRKRPFQSLETSPEVGPTLPPLKKRSRPSTKMKSLPGELPNKQLQRTAHGESRQSSSATIIRRGRSIAQNVPALPKSTSDTPRPHALLPLSRTPATAQPMSFQMQQHSITQAPRNKLSAWDFEEWMKGYEAADPGTGSMIPQHESNPAAAGTSQRLENPPQYRQMHQSAPQQAGGEPVFWHYESQPFMSYSGSGSTDFQYPGSQHYSLYGDDDDMGMDDTPDRPPISVADVEPLGNFREDPKWTTGKGILKTTGQLLLQVAEGLTYLHNHVPPIIHSNLKPVIIIPYSHQTSTEPVPKSNILIDDEGNAKLADIGILQLVEAKATQPQVQGKQEDIRWTAPEVLEGRIRWKPSDVYAFGCVALSESDIGRELVGKKFNSMPCIAILEDLQPYSSLQSDVAVAKAVAKGEMPVAERQASELHAGWRACLAREEFRRPEMQQVQLSVGFW